MSVRTQNLETAGAVYLSFAVHQTGGNDDLTDADLARAGGAIRDNFDNWLDLLAWSIVS